MKKTYFSIMLFACIALVMAGCVATSGIINTHAITGSDYQPARYTTYAWYQEQPKEPADFEKGFEKGLDRNLRKALTEQLQQKGLRYTTENPDLLVAYDVSVSVPLEKDIPSHFALGFGYGYAHMAGYRYAYQNPDLPGYRSVDLFKEGTLIIDLVDPESGQLLWRGWTEGAISNFGAGYGKIRRQVEAIMAKFPGALASK